MYRDKRLRKKFKWSGRKGDSLIRAVQEGNIALTQSIINKVGLNFCESWSQGYVILYTAIKYHRIEIANWLLTLNCRLNRIVNDDPPNTPLHLAILNNQTAIALKLIEKGASVNVQDHCGETPLHTSIHKKNLKVIEILLKDNSIADICDNESSSPLHFATRIGSLEIVKNLLNLKVDVNTYTFMKYAKGCTSLHIAIKDEREDIIESLLESGADVQAIVQECNDMYAGFAPIHIATSKANYNILNLLLKYGADVNTCTVKGGLTPLHLAVSFSNKALVIFLWQNNADFRLRTADGKNVLHIAVENKWVELVEVLILKNADVNDQFNTGETPLHIAVKNSSKNVVEVLLKYGADINIKDSSNQTPIHFAANSMTDMLKILLEKDADIDCVTCDNETPFSIAVKHGKLDNIKLLLKCKPNIHIKANQLAFLHVLKNCTNNSFVDLTNLLLNHGFTINPEDINGELLSHFVSLRYYPIVEHILENNIVKSDSEDLKNRFLIHKAIYQNDIKMLLLLAKHQFDLNALDAEGQSPVEIALLQDNISMLEILLSFGVKFPSISAVLSIVKEGKLETYKILLKYGMDINVSDEFGTTVFHLAVWGTDDTFVKFLLNKKVNINSVRNIINEDNNDEYTKNLRSKIFTSPLHIAVLKKNISLCNDLLESYADVNSTDGFGRTVLHIASAVKSIEQKALIKTIFKYGADINIVDNCNKVALYYLYNQTCVCSIAFQNQYELYGECECDIHMYSYHTHLSEILEIYVRQIVLLNSMNKYVHEQNIEIISKTTFTEREYTLCFAELEKLKKEMITGHNISLYDILTKETDIVAAYCRNQDIVEGLESNNYKNKYPLYSDLIQDKFYKSICRQNLIAAASTAFNKLLPFELPNMIIEKILKFLHLKDLSNLELTNNILKNCKISDVNPAKRVKVD